MDFSLILPILSFVIATISTIVAILTYLRVSRKYHSKTLHLSKEIKPRQEETVFRINGTGSLQKLDITVHGRENATITLIVDGEVFLSGSFGDLRNKDSHYLKSFGFTSRGTVEIALEVDLPKNFFKSLELLLNNKSEDEPAKAIGTLHYDIYEPRFRLSLRKKPRESTDLSQNRLSP